MRTKKNTGKVILILLMFFLCISVYSQRKSVHGVVTTVDKKPLPGTTVRTKANGKGVIVDDGGAFSIDAQSNDTLMVSMIGYQTKVVPLGDGLNSTLIITLIPVEDRSLNDIVVTAYGIRRDKNTLPYAAQQISGDEANRGRVNNIATGLSGKVAGLQIIQNNEIGGSVNVVIRGNKSLAGNNQALFVIDGVPVDNTITTSSGEQTGKGGYDYGNAAGDINPDDIASINVLKGAAASALYGSRAANGVVMITTKKGKSGMHITVNSGVTLEKIDKSTFVKYQQEYGAGRSDPYDKDGFLYFDADGDGQKDLVVPTFAPRSWGPAFDPSIEVMGWDAFDPSSPYYHKARPWVAGANGPETFYQTGHVTNNSIYLDGGSDRGSYKLGYSRNDETGVVPNSHILKNIINFDATYNITKRLTVEANANYSKTSGLGRDATGYDANRNVNATFRQYAQTNVDYKEQKDAYFEHEQNVTWNWTDPTTAAGLKPGFYNNVYWNVYQNYEDDYRSRTFGYLSLNYQVTDWLSLLGRVSLDTYDQFEEERVAVGSVGVASYSRTNMNYNERNYDLLATVNKKLSNSFNLNALAGINLRRNTIQAIAQTTSGGLIIPGLYDIANSKGTIPAPVETDDPKAVDGYFAGATITYKDFLTLDGTFRRDRSSTLPSDNYAYNYYAISGSWAFYKNLKSPGISSGKLTANYATVGNDAAWGSIQDVYDQPNPFGSSILFSLPNTKNNNDLKPERTNSKEVGLEMGFLKERLGFSVSYYHTNTIDQIMPVPVSSATGYSTKYINAGNVENHGVEITLNGTPIRTNSFSWDVTVNFSMNRNKVLSLYENSKNLVLGNFQGGVSLNASLGQPYGILEGQTYQMLNGRPLVDTSGLYKLTTSSTNVIGNVNADWIGGITNTFRYKNFSLSFLIDVRKGGDVFSLDMYYGQQSGIYPNSAGLNDLGNPKRDPVSEGGGVILPGVTADGSPNTKRVTITSNTSTVLPPSAFSYDAGFVKLREASLSYHLPEKVLGSAGKYIKGVDFSLIGRNLWILHKNLPYADPEDNLSAGNIQGYQSGAYPAIRNMGLNIKIGF